MSGATGLRERIEQANARGRMALIPFITAGFPDVPGFLTALRELDEAGADIIEIGVPFSDPVADGPVVEAASRRSLEQGINLAWILETLRGLSPRPHAGLVLMGYYNPFLQYGLERLAREASLAGVGGLIVPDLPLDEDEPLRRPLRAQGLDLIPLVGPNTNEERMAAYAREAGGYVYVVSALGTTGAREGLPPEAEETLARAARVFTLPLALGFGLRHPAQLHGIKARPQAAVFGSALLSHLDKGGSAADFLRPWREV
jgi:tryptophan synthase alpha chain